MRRRKELKLQPPALMLPSVPARPFSRDCRQYTRPSPSMIEAAGAAKARLSSMSNGMSSSLLST